MFEMNIKTMHPFFSILKLVYSEILKTLFWWILEYIVQGKAVVFGIRTGLNVFNTGVWNSTTQTGLKIFNKEDVPNSAPYLNQTPFIWLVCA